MYKIFADNTLIYDSTLEDYKIGKGSISLEINKSGSFSFSIYPDHFYYDSFIKLKTVITVYKSGKIIFRGRILNDVTDYHNNKNITCEGELGFLQDSIIRPFSFDGTPDDLFKKFIDEHNSQVDEFKRFKVGKVTVIDSNNYINRSNAAYESSLSNLNGRLLESSLGGYIYITHGEDGTDPIPTINYLDDFTKISSQKIEFGSNLKNYTKTVKAEDLATAIIPLGHEIDDGDDNTENPKLTIASVNDGKDYLYSEEGVALYGWIFKTVSFDDVTDAANLKAKGEKYLADNVKQLVTIELSAIDLHLLNPEIESISICEYVQAISKPHNFDVVMLCSKQTIDLLKPNNDSYTLGYTYATFTTSTAEIKKSMGIIDSRYVTNQRLTSAITKASSLIEQTEKNILLEVDGQVSNLNKNVSSKLELKVGKDENDEIISMINASAKVITLNSNRLVINSDNFKLAEDGSVIANNAHIQSANGTRNVDINDGVIAVNGKWNAYEENLNLLLLQFYSPNDELCGLYCTGFVDEDMSFEPTGLFVEKIS